jgi:hypothetical protein
MTSRGIGSAYGSAATPAAKARPSLNVLVLKVFDQIYAVSLSAQGENETASRRRMPANARTVIENSRTLPSSAKRNIGAK